ncbi:hypothetical protein [Actibacterium sp. XHP0104]|uniref:hypothetical protein n=1 Tax=Actibacterium sp. XHP0104 TaxID=2984335 RepID=UPI0021E6E3E3|nr:hypothetical protein [Actibacterium sp. XHP0104]MCV2882549.1 hypothetical protein [Actibacterium sp. XHP0104]
MTTLTADIPATPAPRRPGQTVMIYLVTLLALALWGVSFFLWGVPGLYLPAVALVPVIFLLLLIVTRG